MAQIEKTAKLMRLSDTELTIANPAEDIRDRTVVDRDGKDIGEVEDLLIDAHEKRALTRGSVWRLSRLGENEDSASRRGDYPDQ